MLVTLREVLRPARAEGYAVAAFDCVEDVMVRAVLETAEALRAPAIIMCLESDIRGHGWAYVSGLVKAVARHHSIPVVLHLDHATELYPIRKALQLGFTSVMIDGSRLPFEENVELTRRAVELARPYGASVEGELGYVGGMDLQATSCAENVLTEPGEVARFIQQTGVDALAVSIGTAHGVYTSLPSLHIGRLKELHAASTVPLVLHGGSGTPDDQVRQAVRHGIAKLNIYAECRMAMRRGMEQALAATRREDPLPGDLFGPMRQCVAEVVRQKILLLGSQNRV